VSSVNFAFIGAAEDFVPTDEPASSGSWVDYCNELSLLDTKTYLSSMLVIIIMSNWIQALA
jgi:hypothetical protein